MDKKLAEKLEDNFYKQIGEDDGDRFLRIAVKRYLENLDCFFFPLDVIFLLITIVPFCALVIIFSTCFSMLSAISKDKK